MAEESVKFDRAAEFYDETRGFPPGVEAQVAALMAGAGQLNENSRVLEIGVGTGRIALPLSEHVAAVYGLDLSRPMLARLNAKRGDRPVYGVEGDAADLPFAAATFDAVIAIHVFHLMARWRESLRQIGRVLRPGALLIHAWGGSTLKALWEAWNLSPSALNLKSVGIQRDEYETFLPDEGWRQVGETQSITYTYPASLQTFVEWIEQRKWSSTWGMTDEQLNATVKFMQEYIVAHYGRLDQTIQTEGEFQVRCYRLREITG